MNAAIFMASLFAAQPFEAPPESRCAVAPKVERGTPGTVRMRLVGIDWDDWPDLCARIVDSLSVGNPPFSDAIVSQAHERLMALGYFAAAACAADESRTTLSCTLAPMPIVRSTSVDADLPFSMLESDLKRRLFLRPGILLDSDEDEARQIERLRAYMEREGVFGARIDIALRERGGAEPNRGVHVEAIVHGGRTYELGEVRVEGVPLLDPEEARDVLQHYWLPFVTEQFRPAAFEDDVDELETRLRRRGWPEARVAGVYELDDTRGRADVTLTIESGALLRIAFVGNHALDDDTLLEQATFAEEGVLDTVAVRDMEQRLRTRYQRAGFYEVRVDSELEPVSPLATQVTFTIVEGPRAEIERLEFVGNATFEPDDLRDGAGMILDESGLFARRWVDEWADHDKVALVRYYRERGFAAAEVEISRVVVEPTRIHATVQIDEGPRRMVEELVLDGLPESIDERRLRKRLRLTPGDPFAEEHAEADERLVLALLAADGYPRASVEQHIDAPPPDQAGAVRVRYAIVPGTRALFGGVLVRGDFRTSAGLIEQELDLDPGVPLDVAAVGAATRNLRSLGIFSSVQLTPLNDLDGGDSWLLVALEERRALTIDAAISYSTDDAFGVGGDFRDRNLFGRAVLLELSARWANAAGHLDPTPRIGNTDQATLSLRAPRPLGVPFDVLSRALYLYEDKVALNRRRTSAIAGLSRFFLDRSACGPCPDIVGSVNYELAAVTTWRPEPQEVNTIGRVYPKVTFDRTDSPVDPRRGFYAETQLELAVRPLAFVLEDPRSFWRYLARGSGYVFLGTPFRMPSESDFIFGGPIVMALAGQYGAGGPLFGDPNLPVSERFYYGGDQSVRGINEAGSLKGEPDAAFLLAGTLELRWYLLQNLGFGTLQLAGFADYGTVASAMGRLFDDYTVTAGPAVRYVTPVGPLSLAYGFPVRVARSIERFNETCERDPPQSRADNACVATGRLVFGFGYTF